MNILDTRYARLAVAIGARGLTRQRLADLLGKPASAISAWAHEHGPRQRPTRGPGRGGQPAGATTEAIADALDLPPAALEVGGPWGPLVGEGYAERVVLHPDGRAFTTIDGVLHEVTTVEPDTRTIGRAVEVPSRDLGDTRAARALVERIERAEVDAMLRHMAEVADARVREFAAALVRMAAACGVDGHLMDLELRRWEMAQAGKEGDG